MQGEIIVILLFPDSQKEADAEGMETFGILKLPHKQISDCNSVLLNFSHSRDGCTAS
jgi:hypothetical protein